MRKKADIDLAKEVTNIAIAIACIILLSILASEIYKVFNNKQLRDQANAQLDEIQAKIIKTEKDKTEIRHIYTKPKEFSLVYYELETANKLNDFSLPSSCNSKNCLCLCPSSNNYYSLDGVALCKKHNVCRNTDSKIIFSEIKNNQEVLINKNFLPFAKIPAEIIIKFKDSSIYITSQN